MSEFSGTDPEQALRRLASDISTGIRSTPDVLQGMNVEVPDTSDALFDPSVQDGAEPLPRAYRFVEEVVSQDERNPVRGIIEQFWLVEELLIWGHAPGYSEDKVGLEFLDNYCHALLTGPDGPLRCASPLGAFVLFGPRTLYREHSHPPNEVYLALTGGGQWQVDHQPWKQLEAGQTIFIPSRATHALRAGAEPLLTFSFWLEPGDMEEISI